MQPVQDDVRDPAAKDITHAAKARSNLDAAIPMRSAETELQNTRELRAMASEIVAPKPDGSRRQSEKKTILKHFLKGFLEGKSLAPKTYFVRDFLQNSIGNSSTSTTCNPIYSEGTILELQITMEFHRQLIHQHHLQSHLHCGNDPTVANHNGILSTTNARNTGDTPFTMRNRSEHDPTTHETVSQPSHRRGRSSRFGDGLCMEKHRLSCICYLSKTHFVRDFLQNSIGNSSTSTTCNPIYSEGTISLLTLSVTHSFPH